MKRVLYLLAAPALAGGLLLAGVSSATAQEGHHKAGSHVAGHRHPDTRPAGSGQGHSPAGRGKHTCAVAPKCRPDPLPKPPGGWPCAATRDCASHHHRPICKPPVVAHPRPPVVTPGKPASHVAGHKPPPTPASRVPMLPRTGGLYEAGLVGGVGAVGLGALLCLGSALGRARVRA